MVVNIRTAFKVSYFESGEKTDALLCVSYATGGFTTTLQLPIFTCSQLQCQPDTI